MTTRKPFHITGSYNVSGWNESCGCKNSILFARCFKWIWYSTTYHYIPKIYIYSLFQNWNIGHIQFFSLSFKTFTLITQLIMQGGNKQYKYFHVKKFKKTWQFQSKEHTANSLKVQKTKLDNYYRISFPQLHSQVFLHCRQPRDSYCVIHQSMPQCSGSLGQPGKQWWCHRGRYLYFHSYNILTYYLEPLPSRILGFEG